MLARVSPLPTTTVSVFSSAAGLGAAFFLVAASHRRASPSGRQTASISQGERSMADEPAGLRWGATLAPGGGGKVDWSTPTVGLAWGASSWAWGAGAAAWG